MRILLDQNGLTATPVSQVAEINSGLGRITALRVSGLKLTSLPAQVGSLTALRYLVAADNLLDSVPVAVWGLTSLVELDVGGNRILSLDARVSQLQGLLLLGLRGNGLTVLPPSLFSLPHLETLLLAANALDTLSEDVANLAFLKYLDVSHNILRTVPYTLAAMDGLDSLDLSANVMEYLPDLGSLKPAAKVHLAANRLCNLGAQQQAWADAKEPGWKATQVCGSGIAARTARLSPKGLRAFVDGVSVRLELPGPSPSGAPRRIRILDATGRGPAPIAVPAGLTAFSVPRAGGKAGFLWAELREEGRLPLVAPILP